MNKIGVPCCWFTNLGERIEKSKIPITKKYDPELYPKYDNYDAINLDRVANIPADYYGVIGVPITFMHKYNSKQFEIVKFRKGNDCKDLTYNGKTPYMRILIKRRR